MTLIQVQGMRLLSRKNKWVDTEPTRRRKSKSEVKTSPADEFLERDGQLDVFLMVDSVFYDHFFRQKHQNSLDEVKGRRRHRDKFQLRDG